MSHPYYTVDNLQAGKSIGFLVKRCGGLMSQLAERRFAAEHVSFTQWMVMANLDRFEHLTASELSAQTCHDMGALTRVVDDLAEEGLVRRERSAEDRRVVQITLTPEGRRHLQAGKHIVVELLNSLVGPFSREELEPECVPAPGGAALPPGRAVGIECLTAAAGTPLENGRCDMIPVNSPAVRGGWIAKGLMLLKTFGPYAILEFVLPGGTLIAVLLWLYRHRHSQVSAEGTAGQRPIRSSGRSALAWPQMLVAGAAAALTAGCTVGPDFVKPEAPPVAYSRSVPATGGTQSFAYGAAVAGDWYRLFRSDALDQL